MTDDATWRPLVEPQRHKDGIRIVVHAGDTGSRRAACGEPAAWTWLWKPHDVFPAGPVQGATCCPLCLHVLEDLPGGRRTDASTSEATTEQTAPH